MSQSKKRRADSKPTEKTPASNTTAGDRKGRWTGFIIISLVIAVILMVAGTFYYQEYVAPFQLTVIKVDDTTVKMDSVVRRARLTGATSLALLQSLAEEQVIKLEAPRYGIQVSPEDIDQELRRVAQGEGETISESEFKEWYRQLLNEAALSDEEYKEIVHASLLASRFQEYLAARISTVTEQVYLNIIQVKTSEDAEEIRARWETGEDFAELAREASIHEPSKEEGGEAGWVARGVLDDIFDYWAFSLDVGEVSEPIPEITYPNPDASSYLLLMVSEKTDARELDDDSLAVLRDQALQDWLLEEKQFHEITYHGFNNGFDSETEAWINWQTSKQAGS